MTDTNPQPTEVPVVNTPTPESEPVATQTPETKKPSKLPAFIVGGIVAIVLLALCVVLAAVAIIAVNPAEKLVEPTPIVEQSVSPSAPITSETGFVYYQKYSSLDDFETYSQIFKLDLATKTEQITNLVGQLLAVSSDGRYLVYATEDPASEYAESKDYLVYDSMNDATYLLFSHIPGTSVTSTMWSLDDTQVVLSVGCAAPADDGEFTGKTCSEHAKDGSLGFYVAEINKVANEQEYEPEIIPFPDQQKLLSENSLDISGSIIGWNKDLIYTRNLNLDEYYEIDINSNLSKLMPWNGTNRLLNVGAYAFSIDFTKLIYSNWPSDDVSEFKIQNIDGTNDTLVKSAPFASIQGRFFVPGSTSDYYYYSSELDSESERMQSLFLVKNGQESEIIYRRLFELYRMGDKYLVLNQTDGTGNNNLLLLDLETADVTTLTMGTSAYFGGN